MSNVAEVCKEGMALDIDSEASGCEAVLLAFFDESQMGCNFDEV